MFTHVYGLHYFSRKKEKLKTLKCPVVKYITGEGNGTPLQYFCLENTMDGGPW